MLTIQHTLQRLYWYKNSLLLWSNCCKGNLWCFWQSRIKCRGLKEQESMTLTRLPKAFNMHSGLSLRRDENCGSLFWTCSNSNLWPAEILCWLFICIQVIPLILKIINHQSDHNHHQIIHHIKPSSNCSRHFHQPNHQRSMRRVVQVEAAAWHRGEGGGGGKGGGAGGAGGVGGGGAGGGGGWVEWRPQQTRPGRQPQLSSATPRRDCYTFSLSQDFFSSHCRHIFYLRLATFCAERAERPLWGRGEGPCRLGPWSGWSRFGSLPSSTSCQVPFPSLALAKLFSILPRTTSLPKKMLQS